MKHFLFQYTLTLPQCTLALSSVFTLFKITTRAIFGGLTGLKGSARWCQLIWHIDWVPAQINEVHTPKKRLICSFLYYYHAHPGQLSLDHHHSFSVVSTLPIRSTNNNYLLDKCQQTNRYTRGAHNRMHSSVYRWMGLQLGGGRDYKRQFTVCDWPGFEIWNHGKWQVRSGKG